MPLKKKEKKKGLKREQTSDNCRLNMQRRDRGSHPCHGQDDVEYLENYSIHVLQKPTAGDPIDCQ